MSNFSFIKKFSAIIFSFVLLLTVVTPVFAASWTNQGDMFWVQPNHKSVLLNDGKVFIAGGQFLAGITTNHSQLYTNGASGSGSWATKANMNTDRNFLTLDYVTVDATTGAKKVLATGGISDVCSCVHNTAELWDQNTNMWTLTSNMNSARYSHGSSLLSDGKVFVTGGSNIGTTKLNSTEVYDPIANTWTAKASMNVARMNHKQVTFLDNSNNTKVMVIGGSSATASAITSVEVYDPTSNTWSYGPSLSYARVYFAAVILNDGRILVVGGDAPNYTKSEVYDPTTNSWTTYTAPYATYGPQAAVLGSGVGYKVLVSGGFSPFTANAQLFDPSTNVWSTTASMNTARGRFTLTLLNNDEILAAGGTNNTGELKKSERYAP